MSTAILNFSSNFNNKLNCNSFTTLRPYNSEKYLIGKEFVIALNKKPLKKVVVKAVKPIRLHQLNEFIAHLDTGYSLHQTIALLKKFYPKLNLETQPFSFILLATVK